MNRDDKRTKKELLDELHRLRQKINDLEARMADHKEVEERIQASEIRYRRLFESAREGILIIDADTGRIVDVNPYLTEILAYPRQELMDKRYWETGPFKPIDLSEAAFGALLRESHAHHQVISLRTGTGRRIDAELVSNLYFVNNRKVRQCHFRDITEHLKTEERLKYMSTHDKLTGLHNRLFYDEEMTRLGRGRQFPLTLLIADVDGLKQINDRLGHAVGDELLKRAAAVLRETFRSEEVVARIGGDEFAALLPKTDATTAMGMLDRIRNRLHLHNSQQAGPALSLSLGIATAENSQSLVPALRKADESMYREKMLRKLEGLTFSPRDLDAIFKQIDAKLSACPGIHISQLSSELACERHVIERAVKVVKSMQFREYQQMRRLEMAIHLLAGKPLLIKEIANALGYTSPTSLWRLLKTTIGKRPSDIRALEHRATAVETTNVERFDSLDNAMQLKLKFSKS